ncbi:MAG: phosphoglycerate kinase [Methanobacteriota archaeon]
MELPTLDNVDVKDKTAIVRVDINSPLDPKTGEILDDTRIRESAVTIKELVTKGAKVVVLAHQGRPGDDDFTTLEKHAKKLSAAIGLEVKYLMDIVYGPPVDTAVGLMRPGEVLLLENVRYLAEENMNRPMEEQAKTRLVQRLAPLAQIFVSDAFSAAHRSQASIVGFAAQLPAYPGRLMEKEIKGLTPALSPEHPCVYLLGGAKPDDVIKMMENSMSKSIANLVLTGGVLANIFLIASGRDLSGPNLKMIMNEGYGKMLDRAKKLVTTYGDKIKVPVDVVVDDNGQPKVLSVEQLPTDRVICDVGPRTVEEYSRVLDGAKTIVAKGPIGIFERKGFERGSFELLKAMADSKAFTIMGGGHIVAAAKAAGVSSRMKHISTAGGAAISFLTGDQMPGIEALLYSKSAMKL